MLFLVIIIVLKFHSRYDSPGNKRCLFAMAEGVRAESFSLLDSLFWTFGQHILTEVSLKGILYTLMGSNGNHQWSFRHADKKSTSLATPFDHLFSKMIDSFSKPNLRSHCLTENTGTHCKSLPIGQTSACLKSSIKCNRQAVESQHTCRCAVRAFQGTASTATLSSIAHNPIAGLTFL